MIKLSEYRRHGLLDVCKVYDPASCRIDNTIDDDANSVGVAVQMVTLVVGREMLEPMGSFEGEVFVDLHGAIQPSGVIRRRTGLQWNLGRGLGRGRGAKSISEDLVFGSERPQGDSNPCCQDENLESLASRRWGLV